MPRIPQYEQQNELKGLPDARQSSVASTAIFNGPAEAAGAVGKGLNDLGSALTDIAVKEQEKKDLDAIFSREVALKDELIAYEADVRKNRQGRFAEGVVEDTDKWWKERIEAHSATFTSERQRRVFGMRAGGLRTGSMTQMSRWSSEQLDRAQTEAYTANLSTEVSRAAQNAQVAKSPEELRALMDMGMASTSQLIAVQARLKGWAPEVTEAANRKAYTDLYVASIRNIADTNPDGAKQLLTEGKANKNIDGRVLDDLDKLVNTAGLKKTAQTFADTVVATPGMTEEKALAEARSKFSGEEEAAVVHEIKVRYGEQEQIRSRAERAAYKQAWDIADRTGRYSAIPADVLNSMDPHQRSVLREHLQNKAKGTAVRTDIPTWLDVQGKILRGEITDPMQLKEYSTKISESDLQQFATGLAKPEKLLEARIDKQDFDAAAQAGGLRPHDPTKSEEQRTALGQLQRRVEDIIHSEQTLRKRPLTRDEKQEIAKREIANTVMVKGSILGIPVGGSEKPVGALTAEQLARVEPPADFVKKQKDAYRAQGLPTDDATIRQLWVDAKVGPPTKFLVEAKKSRLAQGVVENDYETLREVWIAQPPAVRAKYR